MNLKPPTTRHDHLRIGIAVTLSLFVLVEVNYPLLQPQSRLALFGLLGLLYVFLQGKSTPVPWRCAMDWTFALATLLCFGYVLIQTEPAFTRFWLAGLPLGERAGHETLLDSLVGLVGLVLVLEGARRTVGWSLSLLAVAFLLYARFGSILPNGFFPHRGYGWSRIVSQTFLHSQGVFGIALKVMFTYVFPFVLLGAFLEVTGATGFIIDLSRKVFHRSAGGPAKVAVLSSGLMGSLSGSAVANTATTGTFTIPMMRSAGFPAHLAAAVEAAASSGGALMPPIMGAGAYMMLEIVTPPVTYVTVIKAALIPALLYYLTLLLVVHLYARKLGAGNAPTEDASSITLSWARGFIFLLAMGTLVAFLLVGFTPFRAVTLSLAAVLLAAPILRDTRLSWAQVGQALRSAAQAGMPLIAAAACVGVVLGVVTLTGIGSKLPGAILPLAQGNLLGALFLLMISTLILGMGLPSAVCYLLMATLVGPVLGKLGVEPLAAHLFIFYFGMMSMVTPPVALAAYTAAALAQADIMRTGLAAFRLSLIGFVLPYAFVLHPSLLLLPGPDTHPLLVLVGNLLLVLTGIVLLAVATTGFCFQRVAARSRLLLLAAALAVILMPNATAPSLLLKIVVAGAGIGLLLLNRRIGSNTCVTTLPHPQAMKG